ncbi:tripartite tricarboxylate transporter TctB family protein [Noviherbaspirillum saxi]|uniref:Tripartite tricarboxylate transporter TctB family protein n=2 Tax=Noviherbaspirillum saxi TaxID=2320863 RepID=A0A3A3FM66_9BURK|nr:tripartite tricarboxylate transporter TctB family protein [Noviherbaspirillum saxi]
MGTTSRIHFRQLAIGVFLLIVGAVLAYGAKHFPVDKGYSILGPHVFPMAIAGYLFLVGSLLSWQAVSGGFHNLDADDDADAGGAKVSNKAGTFWVSCGILVEALLITQIGFVLASSILFALAARGFGSKRPLRDVGIGLGLTLPLFWLFTSGLGLALPSLVGPWI